jgi:hypothetical protein
MSLKFISYFDVDQGLVECFQIKLDLLDLNSWTNVHTNTNSCRHINMQNKTLWLSLNLENPKKFNLIIDMNL